MPISILPFSQRFKKKIFQKKLLRRHKVQPIHIFLFDFYATGERHKQKKESTQTLKANKFLKGENEEVDYNLKGQKSLCLRFVLRKTS